MCSVSFLPSPDGFHLLMNRDEALSRPAGLPPTRTSCDGLAAVYPREPSGGTWVGVNARGLTLALINWYGRPQNGGAVSRGMVIPALLATSTDRAIAARLGGLPLGEMRPFRLLAVIPAERKVVEWWCDRGELTRTDFRWGLRHWFSSGWEEETAAAIRSRACRDALADPDAATLPWLRRLHGSHRPEQGPASLCMHRADARTVSFTEVTVSPQEAAVLYHSGPPCGAAAKTRIILPLGPKSWASRCKERRAGTTYPQAHTKARNIDNPK